MSTATLKKSPTKTPTIDTEDTLATVEALAAQLPPSEGEIRERRAYLTGQVKHAREQLAAVEGNRRWPEHKRAAEISKWKKAVEDNQAALDNLPDFSMQVRRQAALGVIEREQDLRTAKALIEPRWTELTQYKLKQALGSSDYVEFEKTSALMVRLNSALRLAARLKSEISDMLPKELIDERIGLEEIAKAAATVRTGPATSDAIARTREWAAAELARLNRASVSEPWESLESYCVAPL